MAKTNLSAVLKCKDDLQLVRLLIDVEYPVSFIIILLYILKRYACSYIYYLNQIHSWLEKY